MNLHAEIFLVFVFTVWESTCTCWFESIEQFEELLNLTGVKVFNIFFSSVFFNLMFISCFLNGFICRDH